MNKLTAVQRTFINIIFKNASRSLCGRRYSTEEQILCLSIYKKSPKAYRYLRSFLPLPTLSTLKKLLAEIRMDCGVTEDVRARLKMASAKFKSDKEKAVIVMWDELLLGLGLHYDPKSDKIVGFEDWGNRRTANFADHGLVFMMRFIDSGDTIPISFNFCNAQTKTDQLLFCIKEVIGAVKDAGLKVYATVCDGGSSNRAAIKQLLMETKKLENEEFVLKCKYLVICIRYIATYILQKSFTNLY